jgi:hypothetical protein
MVIIVNFIKIEITNSRNVHPMNLNDLLGPIENQDPGKSHARNAVIWAPDDLLAQAMEFFLKAEDTWQVIRISADQSIEDLFEQIKRSQPDVIILHTGNCAGNTGLAAQLLQEYPNLRVVTTSLEDNQMQVYSKYSIRVRNASDLLSIIEDRYFSDHSIKEGGE